MADTPQKTRKYTVLAVTVVLIIMAGGIAIDSGTMPFFLNNSSQATVNVTPAEASLFHTIGNLTNPAGSEALREVPTRPSIEGTVSASETESSFNYQKEILSAFIEASQTFEGAGKAMTSYEMTTYNLFTDPDLGNSAHLGRPYGAMATVVINGTPGMLENTLWGYEVDATAITRTVMTSDAGSDTGFVAVSFVTQDTGTPVFYALITAEELAAFDGRWGGGSYICQDDWTKLRYDDSFVGCGYEDPDERLIPEVDPGISYEEFDKYGLYVQPSEIRDTIEKQTIALNGIVSRISEGALNNDFDLMKEASMQLMSEARSIKTEISALPVGPVYRDDIAEFIEGIDNYQYAGAMLWYGSAFTQPDAIRKGNDYLIAGIEHNNNALAGLDMRTINTALIDLPDEDIFPHALYLHDFYRFQDAKKVNDISMKITGVKGSTLYFTTNEDGEEEKVLAGYGYKYVLPVVEVTHYGYRGGGSSRITTPEPSKFTIIWNGEEYAAESPSGYLQPLGQAYTRQYLDRKETVEALLLFKVPASLNYEEAYLKVDLGSEGTPVWHLTERQ
ncbi:hypothetical protein AZH53_05650 [Methanomicrobiaceae archaeon CYW5]|uniref:hypothetical protein n=1 Tax=Methanovulcanius yangii TaxID=1789227 RepID=UPI0029C9C8E1|nr:hypothetical protein [Methanovulcanius yangii]MBT8507897.1 hypothetical protein [Methanovulcanius yangii]